MSGQQPQDPASTGSTSSGQTLSVSVGIETETPIAFVLHDLTLRDTAERDEFEKVATKEILPSFNTNPDSSGAPDLHLLISRSQLGRDYVCLSRLSYSIHHTPLPNWLLNRAEEVGKILQKKLEGVAEVTNRQVFYDVAGWRRITG
jgi:hypothetical protein